MVPFVLIVALVFAPSGIGPAPSGPCSAALERFRQHRASTEAEPIGKQSLRAQLHNQPTPETVERGERRAKQSFLVALHRARKANAAGRAAQCSQALQKAKELYGKF